jgi:exodeoxyribonuclease VII large subunit
VRRAGHRLELASAALRARSPFVRIKEDRRRLEAARFGLEHAIGRQTVQARHRLGLLAGHLNSLSPLAVLGRGYSLTRLASGEIVRSPRQVAVGAGVRVLLDEGRIDCRVEATWEHDERPHV